MAATLTQGFKMEEYNEYIALMELHRYYSAIVSDDDTQIDFKKALDDTLRRWEFVTSWSYRMLSKNVKVLKARPEAPRITEIMNLDEPLCFEDMVCNKTEQRCACCPLWHITGFPCEKPRSIKYNVLKAWRKGEGVFYPHLFTAMLRKLKWGHPLYNYDLEFFTGGR